MKKNITKLFVSALASFSFLVSCSKEEAFFDETETLKAVKSTASTTFENDLSIPSPTIQIPKSMLFNDIPFDLETAVEPSECMTTPFDDVINASIASNLDALGAEWYGLYAEMNFYHTITDDGWQYFGDRGQYTHLVRNIKRGLERFWRMSNEVTVRGQHNATLNDPDKIVDILTFWYGLTEEEALIYADYFINYVNVESTFLTETPLLSFDGFAIALDGLFDQEDLIVIGDGLVELASETGIRPAVVWTGIMAHEWGHQVQFNNFDSWYPGGAADNAPEATRTTELEADFFTGYYLTHRRGGTHNWKTTQQFLDLFYNIGDCSFTSDGHHGTPQQRMEAARRGYELGKRNYRWKNRFGHRNKFNRHRNKHVMNANEVHEAFLDELDEIVGTSAGDDPSLL